MSDPVAYLEVFVSTGAKNAMFTLRTTRVHSSKDFFFTREAYIKNLSTDAEKAERLAIEYADSLRERIGDTHFQIYYVGMETDEIRKRRGKLSARDTENIERIESGIVPFGKHKDKQIVDLPDSYLCWLTDQLKTDLDPIFYALCSIASGIAQDRGLLAKREAAREEKFNQDLKSKHFGVEKTRYEEDVVVVKKYRDEENGFLIQYKYTIMIGEDILFHNGRVELSEGPQRIKFTVKFHTTTNSGVKRTYINRIKLA